MKLTLFDKDGIVDVSFGKWLIPQIRNSLLSNMSKFNFSKWDDFLNTSDCLTRLYKKNYTSSEVIIFASNNLTCSGAARNIIINFKNVFVPGFDRINLNSLVKMIDYGTLDIKGCPIFSSTLTEFADNIQTYARIYYNV